MAQRSVLAQTMSPEKKRTILTYKWMRHFFTETEEGSPDNRPIVELQRRAVWIGLALILQSLNEIDHGWYFPFIQPFGSLIPLALIIGSFYAMWMALRPQPEGKITNAESSGKQEKQPQLWQRIILILTLILAVIGTTQFVRAVYISLGPPQFSNDGTSLDTNAAILILQGRDPYTDSNIPELVRRFDGIIPPQWTTPLRRGQFANRLDYPSQAELLSIWGTSFKADDVPEFEAKVSYPALSFLTLIPFALIGNYNVLPFYLISYLLLIAIAWKVADPKIRPWVLLLGIANIPMWASTVGGNLDIFYTLLLVIAWIKRDQRWLSAIFFGLAIASKQIAWYFAPFYIIMCIQHYGWKEMIQRMTITGLLALLINLPFILWNPYAFYAGVMAPIRDPMFPMGIGIINLSVTHLLPYLPSWVYSGLEYSSMLGCFAWYWRVCRKSPESAMLFAVIPLIFAWRSLASYFYCVAFPIYVVMAAQRKLGTQKLVAFLRIQKSQQETKPLTSTLRAI